MFFAFLPPPLVTFLAYAPDLVLHLRSWTVKPKRELVQTWLASIC